MNNVSSAAGANEAAAVLKSTTPKYVKGFAIAVLLFSAFMQVVLWVGNIADPGNDFRTFYTAGYMARTGDVRNLYDAELQFRLQNQLAGKLPLALPYIHPPYEAYLYAPFSLLNYRNAYFAFLAFNLVLLGVSYWWLRPRMSNMAAVFPWLPLAIFVAFPPITMALLQGQDSVLLLAILVGAALLLDRNRPSASGALLALGLFRFQIVLPIGLLFLLWRRWRFIAGFTGSAAVLFLVSFGMVGWSGVKAYCATLLSFTHRVATQNDHLYRVPPRYILNLRGMISSFHRFHLPDVWLAVLTVLASLAIICLAAKKIASASFTLAVPAAALVSYHFLMHDMSVLLLPLVLVLDQFLRFEGTDDSRRWLFRSAALMFAAPVLWIFLNGGEYLVFLALPVLIFFLLVNARRTEVAAL